MKLSNIKLETDEMRLRRIVKEKLEGFK